MLFLRLLRNSINSTIFSLRQIWITILCLQPRKVERSIMTSLLLTFSKTLSLPIFHSTFSKRKQQSNRKLELEHSLCGRQRRKQKQRKQAFASACLACDLTRLYFPLLFLLLEFFLKINSYECNFSLSGPKDARNKRIL